MLAIVRNVLVLGAAVGGLIYTATFWDGGAAPGTPAVVTEFTGTVTTKPSNNCSITGPLTNGFLPLLINTTRTSMGLPFVKDQNNTTLNSIAQSRITDMVTFNYVGVVNSSGDDISTQLQSLDIPFFVSGMLVFKGCLGATPDNQVAVNDWLAKPDTAAIIAYPNWTSIGFAETSVTTTPATAKAAATGYWLITVVFLQQ
jgi:hypothetical protein